MRWGSFLHLRTVWSKPIAWPSQQRQSCNFHQNRCSRQELLYSCHLCAWHMAFITPVRTGTLWNCHSVFVTWYNSEVAECFMTSSLYKCDHIMPCPLSSASGRQLHILERGFFSFWHRGWCVSGPGTWQGTHEHSPMPWTTFFPWVGYLLPFSPSCFSRENDVAGIDVNMGCPKEYSTKVSWVLYALPKYWVQIKEA